MYRSVCIIFMSPWVLLFSASMMADAVEGIVDFKLGEKYYQERNGKRYIFQLVDVQEMPKPVQKPAPKPVVVQPKKIIMYSRPNCYMRDSFATQVAPIFEANGYTVEYAEVLNGPVPWYEVIADGKKRIVNTYINPRRAWEITGK